MVVNMKMWQKIMWKGAMCIGVFALILSIVFLSEKYYYDSLLAFILFLSFIVLSIHSHSKFNEDMANKMV